MNHYTLILEANASENELDFQDKLTLSSSLILYPSAAPSTIATTRSMPTANATITTAAAAATYQNSD